MRDLIKLSDGHGLYLQVEPSGSKFWRLKYRFNDKEKRLAFGVYPIVTLAQARECQLEARRLLGTGVDPGEYKKQTRRATVAASANTFEAVAREWFLKFSSIWANSHSSKVLLRLENELLPWLGSRPIASIEAVELLESLRRTEALYVYPPAAAGAWGVSADDLHQFALRVRFVITERGAI